MEAGGQRGESEGDTPGEEGSEGCSIAGFEDGGRDHSQDMQGL